ncbi:MAG: SufE family protein [Pseudomonadota bacterium]
MTNFDDILADFAFLDDWDDRYKYLIDLGRSLDPYPDEARTEEFKVKGCASQVWLLPAVEGNGSEAVIRLQGDSDAHIVKGLVAVLLSLFSGKTARAINDMDPQEAIAPLDLAGHLTPQRSNGLASMVTRIKEIAANQVAGQVAG